MQVFTALMKLGPKQDGAQFGLNGPRVFLTHGEAVGFILDEVIGFFWNTGLEEPWIEKVLDEHGLALSDFEGQGMEGVKTLFEVMKGDEVPELATDFLDRFFDSRATPVFEAFYQIADHEVAY